MAKGWINGDKFPPGHLPLGMVTDLTMGQSSRGNDPTPSSTPAPPRHNTLAQHNSEAAKKYSQLRNRK